MASTGVFLSSSSFGLGGAQVVEKKQITGQGGSSYYRFGQGSSHIWRHNAPRNTVDVEYQNSPEMLVFESRIG